MNMTPEQIRTFLTVARRGSFTRAAEELFMTQPAVSQKIQALEKLLGVKLFDRIGKTLRINAAGQRFLQFAQAVKRESEGLLRDIEGMNGVPLETFVIGAVHSVGVYLLPRLIAEFKTQHPLTKVGLVISNTEALIEEMVRGNVELAVIDSELPSLRSFHCEFLLEEEIVMAVPPGHPLAGRELTLEDVYKTPLVMRKRTSRTRRQLEIELAKAGVALDRLTVAYEFDNNEAIKQSICAGLGCGFVPTDTIEQFLKLGVIGTARWDQPIRRKLWLYSKKGEGLRQIQAFRDYLLVSSFGRTNGRGDTYPPL